MARTHRTVCARFKPVAHHDLRDGVLRIAGECSCVACKASALKRLSVHRDGLPDWQCCRRAVPTTAADRAQVACAIAVARYGMRSLARRPRTWCERVTSARRRDGCCALQLAQAQARHGTRSMPGCCAPSKSAHRQSEAFELARDGFYLLRDHRELAAVCSSAKQTALQRDARQWTQKKWPQHRLRPPLPAPLLTCRRGVRTCSGSPSAVCRCRPCPAAR